jgi:hypothetical protein
MYIALYAWAGLPDTHYSVNLASSAQPATPLVHLVGTSVLALLN